MKAFGADFVTSLSVKYREEFCTDCAERGLVEALLNASGQDWSCFSPGAVWNARGAGADWRNMKLKPGKLLCALTEVRLGEQIGGLWRCHCESGTVPLEWKH